MSHQKKEGSEILMRQIECTPSDYEPSPSEKLLFGERESQEVQPIMKISPTEVMTEKQEPTIDEMMIQFERRGTRYRQACNGASGFEL